MTTSMGRPEKCYFQEIGFVLLFSFVCLFVCKAYFFVFTLNFLFFLFLVLFLVCPLHY